MGLYKDLEQKKDCFLRTKLHSQKVNRGSVLSVSFMNFIFAAGRERSVLQCFPNATATEAHGIQNKTKKLKLENIIMPDIKLGKCLVFWVKFTCVPKACDKLAYYCSLRTTESLNYIRVS